MAQFQTKLGKIHDPVSDQTCQSVSQFQTKTDKSMTQFPTKIDKICDPVSDQTDKICYQYTVEILSAFRFLFGNDFINQERIALLESTFHFQIEYCNVPTVALFQIRNADWFIIDIRRMFTWK